MKDSIFKIKNGKETRELKQSYSSSLWHTFTSNSYMNESGLVEIRDLKYWIKSKGRYNLVDTKFFNILHVIIFFNAEYEIINNSKSKSPIHDTIVISEYDYCRIKDEWGLWI